MGTKSIDACCKNPPRTRHDGTPITGKPNNAKPHSLLTLELILAVRAALLAHTRMETLTPETKQAVIQLEIIIARLARGVFRWKPGLSADDKDNVIEIGSVCAQCQIRFGSNDPTAITRITLGTLNRTAHWLLKEKNKPQKPSTAPLAPRSSARPRASSNCRAQQPPECVFLRLAEMFYPAMRMMRTGNPIRYEQCSEMLRNFTPGGTIQRGRLHLKTQQRAVRALHTILLRIAKGREGRDKTYADVVTFLEGSSKQGSQQFPLTIAAVLTYAPFDPCRV